MERKLKTAIAIIGKFMPASDVHYKTICEAENLKRKNSIDNIFIGIISDENDILSTSDRIYVLENSGNANVISRDSIISGSSYSKIIDEISLKKYNLVKVIDLTVFNKDYISEMAECKHLCEDTLPLVCAKLGYFDEFVNITKLESNIKLAERIFSKLQEV